MDDFSTGQVRSADGTTIGFRRYRAPGATGPAVVLVHGGMQAAQHLSKLAASLSDEFEVYVPDRRGRGVSGALAGENIEARQVEDMQAVIAASGASRMFGLSAGALVTLRTALVTPALSRVALYEPPLSVNGSAPVDWVPRYEREVAAGKAGAAVISALKGLRTEPLFARVPRFALAAFFTVASPVLAAHAEGEVSIRELVPTLRDDMRLIDEVADTIDDYSRLTADVMLLGGSKSPAYLHTALDELERVLPDATRVTFESLGHSGPDDDGDPARVAEELRRFFR